MSRRCTFGSVVAADGREEAAETIFNTKTQREAIFNAQCFVAAAEHSFAAAIIAAKVGF